MPAVTHGCSQPCSEHYYLYRLWYRMMQRCYKSVEPKYYRDKGIRVYGKWHDPGIFIIDILKLIGERPSPKHSIDRIRNAGDYKPGNVRWATQTIQNRNKDNNRLLIAFGVELCVAEWAERLKIPDQDLRVMLRSDQQIEDIVIAHGGNELIAQLEAKRQIPEPFNPNDLPNYEDWELERYLSKRGGTIRGVAQ